MKNIKTFEKHNQIIQTNEGIFSDRYSESSEVSSEDKNTCLKIYKQYQSECLDTDGDYSLQFDSWLKTK